MSHEDLAQRAPFWIEVFDGEQYVLDEAVTSATEARRWFIRRIRQELAAGACFERRPFDRGKDYSGRRFHCANMTSASGGILEIIVRLRRPT